VPLSTFEKVVPNLEPYIGIPHVTTNCSPPNYACIDVGVSLEVKGDCNAEFRSVLDGDFSFKRSYVHRNRLIILQSKNTATLKSAAYLFYPETASSSLSASDSRSNTWKLWLSPVPCFFN